MTYVRGVKLQSYGDDSIVAAASTGGLYFLGFLAILGLVYFTTR